MLYNNNCQEGMKGGFLMEDKTKENEEMTEKEIHLYKTCPLLFGSLSIPHLLRC